MIIARIEMMNASNGIANAAPDSRTVRSESASVSVI